MVIALLLLNVKFWLNIEVYVEHNHKISLNISISIDFQFSLLHKQEFAHEESVWCAAWGRTKKSHEKSDTEMDVCDTNDVEVSDFIVTGSLDDTVKVWDVVDNRLELQQQLTGHSLGVVSVAISNDGEKIASSSLDSGLCIVSRLTNKIVMRVDTRQNI